MDFDFSTNSTVPGLERVPENFRGLYAEGQDGQYYLADNAKGAAQAIDGLNKALRAARRDAAEAAKNSKALGDFEGLGQMLGLQGPDATNPATLRQAMETFISESKSGQVNWQKMQADLKQGYDAKLKAKDDELGAMQASLQHYLVTAAATQAIAANKGVAELLLPHIQSHVRVVKEGKQYSVRVVDDAGDPRGNASGGFMTVEDLVKELKAHPVFSRAFEQEQPKGLGTKPSAIQGGKVVGNGQPRSAIDRIAAGLRR